ncbi:EAL domain-containing protein [Aeromicrobium sp.]|uniref:EAL domain-containing protein n=1 Tax=Aeromicrobium sp. TaxID=1871063 RepID=UPI0019A0F467|nr:EAL domain-containing protein [Aeromicrobium sp.]MBC7630465.1 EAL domain-containing protein [Aeromicrobium sp.]
MTKSRLVQVDSRLIEELQEREQQLAEARRLARVGSWEWDVAENRVSWSDELYRIFGLDRHEFDPTYESLIATVHPDDRPMLEGALARPLATHEEFVLRHRVVRPDGSVRFVEGRRAAVVDASGVVVRLYGTLQDLTDITLAEDGAQEAAAAFQLVLMVALGIGDAASIDDQLRFALGEVCRQFSWPVGHAWRTDRCGTAPLVSSGIWHGDEAEQVARLHGITEVTLLRSGTGLAKRTLETKRPEWAFEARDDWRSEASLAQDDTGYPAALAVPVVLEHEVVAVLEFFSKDPITPNGLLDAAMRSVASLLARTVERSRTAQRGAVAEAQLAYERLHDPLTGLANRALFVEQTERALVRGRRRDWSTAVLAIDIDGFHRFNDEFGHDVGDEVLVAVAHRLEASLRQHDAIVRPDGTATRLGADEFLLLCEEVPDAAAAAAIAARTLDAIAAPIAAGGGVLSVAASAGIAVAHGDTENEPESPILDAKAALRHAKERGGARHEFFNVELYDKAASPRALDDALHDALERGEFRLAYQPRVSLSTNRIDGVEALLRWDHPQRGLVSPAEFIPAAEASGLIVEIGAWVLREACRQGATWQRAFPRTSPLSVAINVSARQFRAGLVDTVRTAIADSGIDPAGVFLEVTETTVMDDVESAITVLGELKKLGLAVSIDDFGTGHSSLAYLRRLPLDEVKIDKSFVDGLGANPEDTAIVAAVISLAHALDHDVVAEGVETLEQLEKLRSLGCEFAQGYFLARPMAASDLFELLAGDAAGERLPRERSGGAAAAHSGAETVLVADDAADVRQLARMSLTAGGFTVVEAVDGAAALALARRLLPDCVVLDIRMPDMTGIEVCKALRSDPSTAGCTIVMLTSRADATDKAEAFSAGADDYIVKPFAPRDLVSRVRSALRRRQVDIPT